MKDYIGKYIREVELYMSSGMDKDSAEALREVIGEFETKITYFSHERLIHLIVTVLFAILEILSILSLLNDPLLAEAILSVMFLVLLIPYVMHYYFLENSVQKMYRMRDSLKNALKEKEQ